MEVVGGFTKKYTSKKETEIWTFLVFTTRAIWLEDQETNI